MRNKLNRSADYLVGAVIYLFSRTIAVILEVLVNIRQIHNARGLLFIEFLANEREIRIKVKFSVINSPSI